MTDAEIRFECLKIAAMHYPPRDIIAAAEHMVEYVQSGPKPSARPIRSDDWWQALEEATFNAKGRRDV